MSSQHTTTKGTAALGWLAVVLLLAICWRGTSHAAPRWSPSLSDGPVANEPAFWLVRDGQPQATIVIAADPVDTNQLAAELLQDYVRKISGATLPVVGDSQPVDGPVILIGRSRLVEPLNLKIPSGYTQALDEEGYLIRTIDKQLVLVGNDHRPSPAYKGSLFAVVEVLQRLGCRWYFPGEFGEVHPSSRDISLPHLEEHVKPDMPVRGFWYGVAPQLRKDENLKQQMERWQALNRLLPYGSVLPSATDGSIMAPFRKWAKREVDGKQVRVNTVFEEHPEYFALNSDGERTERYLCLANPDVLDVVTQHALDYFKARPDSLAYGIAPPDGVPSCECEDCRGKNMRFMQRDPALLGAQDISGGFYWFMNELAKRLDEQYPDKWLTSTAYAGRIRPPENLELHENITLHTALLAHSRHHRYDSPTWHTRDRVQHYKRWTALSDAIVEREYYPVFQFNCNVPQQMYRTSAFNIRMVQELGMRGVEWEGRAAFFSEGASNYIRGQLLWNTDTDVDALLDDYYTRFYGSAAAVVRTFDETVEDALTQSMVDHHEEERIPEIYKHDFVVSATDAVGDVEALVADADEKTRQRVGYFAMRARHFRAYSDMRDAENDLNFKRAAELAQLMIDIEDKVNQISPTLIDSFPRFMDQRSVYGELGANASAHGKIKQYVAKHKLIDGTEGRLVTALPLAWQFKPDPHNEGVLFEWHQQQPDEQDWRQMNTTASWEIQGMQDEHARGYDGFAWYRTSFDVPEEFDGQPLSLFIGGMNNQAWIWVNNKLVAAIPFHRYWERWLYHSQTDISEFIKSGETNQIAIRVWNDQGAGGLFRRSFIYAPVTKE